MASPFTLLLIPVTQGTSLTFLLSSFFISNPLLSPDGSTTLVYRPHYPNPCHYHLLSGLLQEPLNRYPCLYCHVFPIQSSLQHTLTITVLLKWFPMTLWRISKIFNMASLSCYNLFRALAASSVFYSQHLSRLWLIILLIICMIIC